MCLSVSSPDREFQLLLLNVWIRPCPLHTQLFHTGSQPRVYCCLLVKLRLAPLLSLSGHWRRQSVVRGGWNVQKLHDGWEMLYCLDNNCIFRLLIDILLAFFAYSVMKPAVFQTMERDFVRNVGHGSKELFTQVIKTEQAHALHGSIRCSSSSVFHGMQRQLPIILFEYDSE